MRKIVLSAAAAVIAVSGLVPALAGGKAETKTQVLTNGVAYVEAKGSDAKFGGPGIAKLVKNGKTLKTDDFNFKANDFDKGGLGYPKALYADKDGDCKLIHKFKGTSKYAASKDDMTVKCRKPE